MDYFLAAKKISVFGLKWRICIGRLRNFSLNVSLADSVLPFLQMSYVVNENQVRALSDLPSITIDQLAKRKNRYCLIHKDGTVIGSLLSYSVGNDIYLNMLFVLPDFRGRGIGRLLVALLLHDQLRKFPNVTTFITDPTNQFAGNILSHFGFKPARR